MKTRKRHALGNCADVATGIAYTLKEETKAAAGMLEATLTASDGAGAHYARQTVEHLHAAASNAAALAEQLRAAAEAEGEPR